MKYLNFLFNTDSLKQSRLPWMDFTKGIAIIFVVYRHILIGLNRSGIDYDKIYFIIAEIGVTFRMHLFFIIAGIFIRRSIEKRTNQKFVFDKLKSLMYPYIIWTILQVTVQIVMGKYTNSHRTMMDYLYIFTVPRAIDQFWYIYALFNVSILYLFLFKITNGNRWLLFIIGLIMYLLGPFVEISVLDDILDFFVFMVLGDVISSFLLNPANKKYFSIPALLVIVTAFGLSMWFYFRYVMSLQLGPNGEVVFMQIQESSIQGIIGLAFYLGITALLGSCLTINLAFLVSETSFGRFIRVFGFHSLYIYLMHSMVAAFFRVIMVRFAGVTHPEFLLFICCLVGCIIPIVAYNIMAKKGLWFFFTPDNPNGKSQLSSAA